MVESNLRSLATLLIAPLVVLAATELRAQELEPRAYSVSPVGTNFLAVSIGRTSGEVLFDASVPITNVDAELALAAVGYGRTFALGRRQGLVTVLLPYVWGSVEGLVQEAARQVRREGFGDLRVKTSLNLIGPQAMRLEEFRKAPRRTLMGVSLTLQAPSGEYDETKLINLGTNRFAIKPELGVSVPVGRWYLDAYAGAWFFETNDEFFPGEATRRQDPLMTLQAHASYTFPNRTWLAFDATWYGGGAATVDSNPPSTRQSNSRLGATLSLPVSASQSLKLSASTGVAARAGSDFDSILAGWQLTWFDRSGG